MYECHFAADGARPVDFVEARMLVADYGEKIALMVAGKLHQLQNYVEVSVAQPPCASPDLRNA